MRLPAPGTSRISSGVRGVQIDVDERLLVELHRLFLRQPLADQERVQLGDALERPDADERFRDRRRHVRHLSPGPLPTRCSRRRRPATLPTCARTGERQRDAITASSAASIQRDRTVMRLLLSAPPQTGASGVSGSRRRGIAIRVGEPDQPELRHRSGRQCRRRLGRHRLHEKGPAGNRTDRPRAEIRRSPGNAGRSPTRRRR